MQGRNWPHVAIARWRRSHRAVVWPTYAVILDRRWPDRISRSNGTVNDTRTDSTVIVKRDPVTASRRMRDSIFKTRWTSKAFISPSSRSPSNRRMGDALLQRWRRAADPIFKWDWRTGITIIHRRHRRSWCPPVCS